MTTPRLASAPSLSTPGILFAALCLLLLLQPPPAAAQYSEEDIFYSPTSVEVTQALLELAEVKKDDVVYDLGSGDGRIVIMAAQKFGARGVGIEINPELIRESEENARNAGVSERVKFIQHDMFDAPVGEASVVTLYIGAAPNLKLRPRLVRELRVGARIVSNNYDMGEWEADKKVKLGGFTLYLWTVTEEAKAKFVAE